MNLCYLIFIILILFENVFCDFPSDIKRCKAGDTICIAKLTTQIVRNNPNGRIDLGLPVLDPYHLSSLPVTQGNGSISLILNFHDLDLEGLSTINVDEVKGFTKDPETSKFELSIEFPVLTLKGKYTIGGRILILPISGSGDAHIVLRKVHISAKYKPTIKRENGKIYIGVKKLKVLVEPSKIEINFDNLFDGNKILGDNMNAFLNENWQDVWEEVRPSINVAISEVFSQIISSVLKTITYDEFYDND